MGKGAVFTLLMLVLTLGTLRAMLMALPNLNLREPVALPLPPQDAGARTATERRVLVVLVDGLRADLSRELPFLGELTRRGARAELWLETPSYSSAQWVAFLTGVPPRDSGIRTNVDLPRVVLDNVPRRVRAAGRTAVEIGDEVDWWRELFGDDFTSASLVAPDELPDRAIEAIPGAELLLVHLTGVDRAGHRVGAAAEAYRLAARRDDAVVRRLAEAFGWPDATVVVLSDHGHTLHGGHGGDEAEVRNAWMIASGPGVRAGAEIPRARAADVAPTLAALLGVPAPANAVGRTLVEALETEDAGAELAAADRTRIERATAAATLGRRGRVPGEIARRVARGAGVVICLGLVAWLLRRSWRPARAGLVAGLAALAIGVVGYFAWFERVSFSADRDARSLAAGTLLVGATAAAIAFAWPALQVVRRRLSTGDACAFALGALVGASPLAAVTLVAVGAYTPRLECEPAWVACGPLLAYALFAPAAGACALLVGVASIARAARRTPRA